MWRILDLRAGKYVSVISLLEPNSWSLLNVVSMSEHIVINRVYSYIRNVYPINISQSSIDKQDIITDLIDNGDFGDLISIYWNVNNYKQAVSLYLQECLSEKIIEVQTKKKALLEIHKCFRIVRHFYEAVEIENNFSEKEQPIR